MKQKPRQGSFLASVIYGNAIVEAVHVFLFRFKCPKPAFSASKQILIEAFSRAGGDWIGCWSLVLPTVFSFIHVITRCSSKNVLRTYDPGAVLVGWIYVLSSQAGFGSGEPTALPVAIMWLWASDLTCLRASSFTYKMGASSSLLCR